MYKKIIVGRGSCKHPCGRANPSCEFVISGKAYYFCQGWSEKASGDFSDCCTSCDAFISAADDLLHRLIEEKELKK